MVTVSLERLQLEARRVAGWTTTALGFTIPIWVVADSILLTLLVVCWLASGEWKERARRITTNPVAVSVLLLFGWLLLGTLWGEGSLQERALAIKKYADLLLVPVLISIAVTVQERHRAILTLAVSLLATLLLSFGLGMGFLPLTSETLGCNPSDSCVFKKHTTHNVLMAFGALLFVVLAWKASRRWVRWGWSIAAVLAASNVLFLVQGRTGYLVLAGLAMLVFHVVFGWRGVLSAIVVVCGVFWGAYQISSSFHQRVDLVTSGMTQWDPHVAVVGDSIGWRLEYVYHTVEIIQDHPLVGVGTGGFVQAYRARTAQAGLDVPPHPHNQYLFIMAQVGIGGLGLLLWLFAQQWRVTTLASDVTAGLLAKGLIVTIAITCLFQPALNDHTEKLFYCLFSGLMCAGNHPQSEAKT
ncbi:MAG: O-antigen ligase family protein [Nitrospira sp.]|nr:O-antigen ligase family protein [Nitrospira sp.]